MKTAALETVIDGRDKNVADGLFAIADALEKCASALSRIGHYHHPDGGHDLDTKYICEAIEGAGASIASAIEDRK